MAFIEPLQKVFKSSEEVTSENAPLILVDIISQISEASYAARWYSEIEFMLWDEVQGTGTVFLLPEQVEELKRLSDICAGWVRLDEEQGREQFVPLAKWEELYHKWKTANSAV